MSTSRRPVVYALGIVAVAIVGWVGLAPAKSGPPRDEAERQCNARVKALEAEILFLREQMRDLSGRQGNTPTAHSRSRASRIGAIDGRQSRNTLLSSCEPPYAYDQHGIKSYKPECLDSAEDDCSVPYTYTNSGIKTYKPDCLDKSSNASSCDAPFTVDAQGIKSYKPECL
jgi:hypothetical protein